MKMAKLPKKTKKLYEKPILTSEPIFETLALACIGHGLNKATEADCHKTKLLT